MKNIISKILLATVALWSFAASAATYHSSLDAAEAAYMSGDFEAYTPHAKNPPKGGLTTVTSCEEGCAVTMWATGPDGKRGRYNLIVFEGKILKDSTGKYYYSECYNRIYEFRILKKSKPEVSASAPAIATVTPDVKVGCDSNCEPVKPVCSSDEEYTVENGITTCVKKVVIKRRTEVVYQDETRVTVQPAPMVQVPAQQARVQQQGCGQQQCGQRDILRMAQNNVPAPFCGVRTDRGDVLAFLDNGGRLQVVKNPTIQSGRVVSAEADAIFNQIGTAQFNHNCDAVQKAVETAGWQMVVQKLSMSACAPAERITPTGNKFGNM